MELHSKEALISAIGSTRKPVAFLVGSPLSTDTSGKGVPGVSLILNEVREVVLLEAPSEITRYDQELNGKAGVAAYQTAIGWLQANVSQDAVNMVIRRAVLKACIEVSSVGDLSNPTSDGEPEHWYIPAGTKHLGSLSCSQDSRFHGPILTPNFDPLLSLAIRAAGGHSGLRVLDSDGALPRDLEKDGKTRNIVHLHGYWRGSDTLHTPSQLRSHRPKLKASLQRLLRNHVLLVVAYGGWDDVFTSALADLLHDDQAELDVIWCFRETSTGIIADQYKTLFESVTPAITRGRFRCYGGIDCHSIFSDIIGTTKCATEAAPAVAAPLLDVTTTSQPSGAAHLKRKSDTDFVDRYFAKRLDDALLSFSCQPKVWVEPSVRNRAEIATDAGSAEKIDLYNIISAPKSAIIKAPPQFGLTCLALYLTREAWLSEDSSLWVYLDAKTIKPNSAAIDKAVESELKLIGCKDQDIKCVILDSWFSSVKDHHKLLRKLSDRFKEIPIIVMQTLEGTQFVSGTTSTLDREFQELYLWALPRGQVRKVVSDYNECKHIGDEDKVTTKVVSDLEVLNLHRTPYNCLTMLKVSEIDFDESPVNRSEMIKRVLFLLFNVDDIPTYKVRPDLKDSEYVLGYFCETMIRKNNYMFTREYFLEVLDRCCKERFIDLEVQVVFDVLYANNILIKRGYLFEFRFSFWIYYFAAQRMVNNQEFAEFVYENMRYANFPEILEFYTGIDRQREDALHVLIKDLRATCNDVQKKTGSHYGFNPYQLAKWDSPDELIAQMQNEITNGVISSNLPASVKDSYADRQYDRTRPYDQSIQNILTEFSFVQMAQAMKAGARALRNSDYADPTIKRELLAEIMRSWELISTVLIVLAPLMAERGHASFDGAGFMLCGDFGSTPEKRFYRILNEMPSNVVCWFQDDLFSQKMGPLLISHLLSNKDDITTHEVVLMLIHQRPRGWKTAVQDYITKLSSTSFFLWDIYRTLRAQYRFSYASQNTLRDIEYLIKMAAAKHITGAKSPGIKLISKIESAIPPREAGDADDVRPVGGRP